jgi:hypothetical protein
MDFYVATKSITIKINFTTTPWFATANPETRYLINEIVYETDTTNRRRPSKSLRNVS